MPQERFWNYKDNDSTFRLNSRELGMLENGLYRGFDAVLVGGLSLELEQSTTGVTKTLLDPLTTSTVGVWYTKQGGVITETDSQFLAINANASGNDRIDLIVGQHEYVATIGGAAALYAVIQGTPAASPTVPSLTIPTKQVILGQLYVPDGTTSLTDAGVVYTKAVIPDLANDGSVIHGDRPNTFTSVQTFLGVERFAGVAQLDITGGSFDLLLEDASGDSDSDHNFYVVNPNAAATDYWNIETITVLPAPVGVNNIRKVVFYTPISLFLNSAGIFDRNYHIKANSAFTMVFTNSTNYIIEGDQMDTGTVNRVRKMQILEGKSGQGSLTAGGFFNLSTENNIYNLQNTLTNKVLKGIQATSAFEDSTSGGFVFLTLSDFPLTLEPFNFTGSPNYKPIWTPNQDFLHYDASATLCFVEGPIYWHLVDSYKGFQPFTGNTPAFNGGGSGSFTNENYRYSINGNRAKVEYSALITISGVVNQILFDLPPEFVPSRLQLLGVCGAYALGATPETGVIIATFSGNQLALYKLGGAFDIMATRDFGFSVDFEIAQP